MKLCILATSVLMLLSVVPMASAQQVSGPGYWQVNDTDEDGIPDGLERQLIDRYRPIYRYDSGEYWWPSTCTWQAAQSELRRSGDILFTHDEMAADPENALRGHLRFPNLPSTMEMHATFRDFRLNIYNSTQIGQWAAEGYATDVTRMGIFAWCQVVTTPPNYHGTGNINFGGEALPYVMIQYFQFFSYNNAEFIGDHEGDWTFLDVFVKPRGDPQDVNTYDLIGLVYHHHGDGSCNPSTHHGGELPPDDIPVCFLEDGAHEWYINPHERIDIVCGVRHNARGNGVQYRVSNVMNLGAKFAVLDEATDTPAIRLERRLTLFYNGRWGAYQESPDNGTAPPGPSVDVRSQYVGA